MSQDTTSNSNSSPQNHPIIDDIAADTTAATAAIAIDDIKSTLSSQTDESDTSMLIIDELVSSSSKKHPELPLPPPPSRPVKKKVSSTSMSANNTNNNMEAPNNSNNDNDNFNTAADARGPRSRGHGGVDMNNSNNSNNNMGTKPKQSNMTLLSSAVAHSTLERCLLGVNGGETMVATTETTDDIDDNDNASSTKSKQGISINYSKKCKPGHVIDILELRRLSSRGVPDEPPDERAWSRALSTPTSAVVDVVEYPSTPTMESESNNNNNNAKVVNINQSSNSNSSGGGGNMENRSYRALVWRVLLGYLPPQTSQWNEVLYRDRKLYETLVNELFSCTCPRPHDVYTVDELEEKEQVRQQTQQQQRENEVYSKTHKKKKKSSSDSIDEDNNNNDNDVPSTPTEGGDDEEATNTATVITTTNNTPMTPGLLSARMQQEWVRGEGGEETIFDGQQQHNTNGGDGDSNNGCRLSPMCAMNTPRTRIRKEAFMKGENDSMEHESGTLTSGMESLLLPEDEDDEKEEDDDEEDGVEEGGDAKNDGSTKIEEEKEGDSIAKGDSIELMETVSVESTKGDDGKEEENHINTNKQGQEVGEESKNSTLPNNALPGPPEVKLSRSISITKTSSEEEYTEGVELCRKSSKDALLDDNDDDDDTGAIHPHPESSVPDTDEEENVLLLDEIRKDVIRTHPDLRFFLEPKEDLGQKRYAALERILFVWAKLNKGVRYVQGMNEIVGTLYFVLAHDSNEDWSNEAEADTYFLFNSLMVEMRDVFVPDLDDADTGIHGRISNMITLLSLHDPEVRCHLDSVGIDPSFYSVRWLTTLLSREFLLPDTIRLWDSMFASTHKDNFLRYVCVTMVMVIRDQLLCGDFSACLRLLQAYPPTNLDRLLESSRALWIYESQITLACHKGGISLGHALRSINPPPAIIMAYGLQGGVAPPIREQVRQVGQRGIAVARGASTTAASAGRSFFSYLRGNSSQMSGSGKEDGR